VHPFDLMPGMVVFKVINDGEEPIKYLGDGVGNVIQVGIVVGIRPTKILSAKPPYVYIESDYIKQHWTHYGWLIYVGGEKQKDNIDGIVIYKADFRTRPFIESKRNLQTPYLESGTVVTIVSKEVEGWYKIKYKNTNGYIEKDAISIVEEDVEE
jgi:hypothetical protein